ncbi:MAG TPA: Holliday junction resolvase RuvX [Candidatus Saccharimonadia bacterium]|nr:Holliday junction resolvase RuvX [Candidatus Saccharimonadia bacterium]
MAAQGYIVALDYGDKRVGVAITHTVARLPRPLTTLENTETLLEDIRKLVTHEDAKLVVVGLPRGMDGGYTAQTKAAEMFAKKLQETLDVSVVLADETLTSVDAEGVLNGRHHQKGDVDALAATFILDRYLADNPAEEA